MNTLMNMDPFGLLDELFGIGSRTCRAVRARAAGRFPPVNFYLDDNAVLLDIELPGRSAKDVDLTLGAQAVVIADKPATPSAGEGSDAEIPAPAWSRRVELPFRVDADKASAKFANGILRVELPKAEVAASHKIAIQ